MRWLPILALLAAGALLFAATATNPAGPRPDLTILQPVDVNTLDPQRMSWTHDFRIAYAIYEGLCRWESHSPNFPVVPAAARTWEISPNGLTYTFHLDERARWSNGEPVRAQDFIYSWKRALMPETAADYTKLFFLIAGAEDFFGWRTEQLERYTARPAGEKSAESAAALRREADAHFATSVGLAAPDDRTLRIDLVRPTPYFLDLMAFGAFLPVHPPTVEAWVDVDAQTGAIRQAHGWTKPPHIVTSGPLTIDRWVFKRELDLRPNPHYRDPSLIKSGRIRTLIVEDQNTSVLAYESGAADWHADVQVDYIGDMLAQQRAGEREDLHDFTAFGTYFWSFNCKEHLADGRRNPFADRRVRRAFSLAVNKQELVERVRRSGERVADSLIPRGSIPGFEPARGLPFDPQRARAELQDAGLADRDNDGFLINQARRRFPTVEILYTPVGPHRDLAIAIAAMWERELGVRTRLAVRETKVFRNSVKTQDYMVARGSWFGDYLDPTTFLDIHRTGDGNNDRAVSDPHYDELLARAERESDPDSRMRILEEAARYADEDLVPVLPIFHYNQYYLFKPPADAQGSPNPGGLRGISTHPRLVQYLYELEVVRVPDEEP